MASLVLGPGEAPRPELHPARQRPGELRKEAAVKRRALIVAKKQDEDAAQGKDPFAQADAASAALAEEGYNVSDKSPIQKLLDEPDFLQMCIAETWKKFRRAARRPFFAEHTEHECGRECLENIVADVFRVPAKNDIHVCVRGMCDHYLVDQHNHAMAQRHAHAVAAEIEAAQREGRMPRVMPEPVPMPPYFPDYRRRENLDHTINYMFICNHRGPAAVHLCEDHCDLEPIVLDHGEGKVCPISGFVVAEPELRHDWNPEVDGDPNYGLRRDDPRERVRRAKETALVNMTLSNNVLGFSMASAQARAPLQICTTSVRTRAPAAITDGSEAAAGPEAGTRRRPALVFAPVDSAEAIEGVERFLAERDPVLKSLLFHDEVKRAHKGQVPVITPHHFRTCRRAQCRCRAIPRPRTPLFATTDPSSKTLRKSLAKCSSHDEALRSINLAYAAGWQDSDMRQVATVAAFELMCSQYRGTMEVTRIQEDNERAQSECLAYVQQQIRKKVSYQASALFQIYAYALQKRRHCPPIKASPEVIRYIIQHYGRVCEEFRNTLLRELDFIKLKSEAQSLRTRKLRDFAVATLFIMRSTGIVINGVTILERDRQLEALLPDETSLDNYNIVKHNITKTTVEINRVIQKAVNERKINPNVFAVDSKLTAPQPEAPKPEQALVATQGSKIALRKLRPPAL